MRVVITADVSYAGPDLEYAHYPGQVLVDHPHEREWIAKGQARPLDEPRAPEVATAAAPEHPEQQRPEETALLLPGSSERRRKRAK